MESKELVNLAAQACDEKRAQDIVVLDMSEVSLIADYFLICEGSNERQVQAIARELKNQAEENGIEVKRMEGFEQARWVLVDLNDIVCHIFHKDERHYYNLERLWGDADTVAVEGLEN
ncbi:ribosome silencing factor [Halobacillus litoralis]|uniref:Ribosomal silencing factor RsfS n=3 Tax=Halobacillus TaxID=45667 RepID=A0A3D8VRW6_9BACI|nr:MULTISPECIES: ribosome silencing factor [Halobacillus]MYL47890.1 ribosome silencing factor [Halobacillus litoralis]RDY71975.1 ribosome silencing factor [Halobacillus trueperi]REJ10649.1 ribosome silencing factor [Halobacillus trueperi]WLR46203.1 ribosome silencing factor [Halobacillus litoralis]SDP56583.1 ribosome-associated protein [Halobacillus aidingensis]